MKWLVTNNLALSKLREKFDVSFPSNTWVLGVQPWIRCCAVKCKKPRVGEESLTEEGSNLSSQAYVGSQTILLFESQFAHLLNHHHEYSVPLPICGYGRDQKKYCVWKNKNPTPLYILKVLCRDFNRKKSTQWLSMVNKKSEIHSVKPN